MDYYDLIDLIKEEMVKQGIKKTRLCEMTGTEIRTMNSYLCKQRCMPMDKLISILKILGKQIEIADVKKKG